MGNKIAESAGVVIIQDNKILLVHPKNASWWYSWSIPKGGIEENETSRMAAIRETKEEIGLKVAPYNLQRFIPIEYLDKKGRVYKIVMCYILKDHPKKIKLEKLKLQKSEVDYVDFFDYSKAKKRINSQLKPLLKLIKDGK